MKRESLAPRAWWPVAAAAALVLAGSLAAVPMARADVDVRLDLGNAPAAPNLYFRTEPHRVYDSTAGVYVIDDPEMGDDDAFEYGGTVWVFHDGFWYRSAGWDGDFAVVSPREVPAQVYNVPSYRWHHHPSYDSVHLQGWHARDWQDRDVRDNGVRYDNNNTDVRYDDTRYRDDSGYTGTTVQRHHHHGVHVGVDASVRVHKSHHHHHVDRRDRDAYDRDRDQRDRDDR